MLPIHEALIGTLPSGALVTREYCGKFDGIRVGHREAIGLDDVEALAALLQSIRIPAERTNA